MYIFSCGCDFQVISFEATNTLNIYNCVFTAILTHAEAMCVLARKTREI